MTATWKDNAAAFRDLDSGEGWPFARLVACSVEQGNGQGKPRRDRDEPRNDRYEVGNRRDRDTSGKVSAREFANVARTSADRVLRFYTAWERAADQGIVPHAADLTPADARTMTDPDVAWKSLYDASKSGGRPRAAVSEIVSRAERDPDYARELASQIMSVAPDATTEVAMDALTTRMQHDPRVVGVMDTAVTTHYAEARRDMPRPKVTESSHTERWTEVATAAHKAHHQLEVMARAVVGFGHLSDVERAAIASTVTNMRNALDLIEAGLASGSWDDQLAALVDGGAS